MRYQQGIALITILMLVALATILAASIARQQSATMDGSAYFLQQNQALLYAKSAEAFFSELLIDDAQNAGSVDHLQETWAQPMPPFPIEGGVVQGTLEDQSGKFNLNSLVQKDGESVNEAAKQSFERLLQRVGLAAQLSEAVIDWQDVNDEVLGTMGAESAFYSGLEQGYLASNNVFHHIEQLKQVRGFEGQNFFKIRDYVTVGDREAQKINVNTASAMLLASLDPKLNINDIEHILKQRRENMQYWESVSEFWNTAPFDQVDQNMKAQIDSLLGVQSNTFLAKIEIDLHGRKRQFSSGLVRDQQKVSISARSLVPF